MALDVAAVTWPRHFARQPTREHGRGRAGPPHPCIHAIPSNHLLPRLPGFPGSRARDLPAISGQLTTRGGRSPWLRPTWPTSHQLLLEVLHQQACPRGPALNQLPVCPLEPRLLPARVRSGVRDRRNHLLLRLPGLRPVRWRVASQTPLCVPCPPCTQPWVPEGHLTLGWLCRGRRRKLQVVQPAPEVWRAVVGWKAARQHQKPGAGCAAPGRVAPILPKSWSILPRPHLRRPQRQNAPRPEFQHRWLGPTASACGSPTAAPRSAPGGGLLPTPLHLALELERG